MDDVTLFQFAIGFAVCIIFSAFAIMFSVDKKPHWEMTITWDIAAAICWFAFAVLNVSLASDEMFYSYSWLYMGFGLIFMMFTVVSVIKLLIASTKTGTSIALEASE